MKIIKLITFIIFLCVFITYGCTNIFNNTSQTLDTSNADNLIWTQKAYIGGSVFFNPADPTSGHLQVGKSIAIRLGKVSQNNIDSDQTVYQDIPDQAKYGFLTVLSINSQMIRFKYTLYDRSGNEIVESCKVISLNSSCDLDVDGIDDLSYEKPNNFRPGLESAIYLNFLSSQKFLTTAMFAILPNEYSFKGCSYPSGIIGINPDGKFIISRYETDGRNPSIVKGVIPGDYVFDSSIGQFQKVENIINSRTISDNDVKIIQSSARSYRDVAASNYLFTVDAFTSIGLSPITFYDDLPDSVKTDFNEPTDINSAIDLLNQILQKRDLVELISNEVATTIPADALQNLIQNIIPSVSNDDVIRINRLFLNTVYPNECPSLDIDTEDITTILPLLSCTIGNPKND